MISGGIVRLLIDIGLIIPFVHVGQREKGGDRQRSVDEPHEPEQAESADNRQQNQQGRQLRLTADESRFEKVVDGKGEHQVKNFLLAYEALKYLGIADEVIKKALKKVTWKGRFELVSKNPFVILDGAHNEDAARALSSNIEKLFNKNEVVLIISILKDKDVDSILKNMNKCSDTAIFTGIDNVRGLSADEMYKAGKSYFNNSHEKKSLGGC